MPQGVAFYERGGAFSSVVDLSLPNTANKQYEGEWVYLQEKQLY